MDLDEIRDTFAFLDDWEDKYRFILDIGREVPTLPDSQRDDQHLVQGCQSQVWLVAERHEDGRISLAMDSDAHIVRGLIGIVLAALNNRTGPEILEFDMDALFGELELLKHLSPTRGNGLMAMLGRIRAFAGS